MDKAMVVLAAVIAEGGPIGLAELTRRTGLAKPTVHRVLTTLRAHQMIDQHGGRYGPGMRLDISVDRPRGDFDTLLASLATPYLVDLHRMTGATASLGVLDGREVRYIDRVYDHRAVRTPSHRTNRAPAYGTAIGRSMLAETFPANGSPDCHGDSMLPANSMETLLAKLSQVRRSGIAFSHEEYVGGVVCAAAPVSTGGPGQPPVGLAVSDRVGRLDFGSAAEKLRRVSRALAADIHRLTAILLPDRVKTSRLPSSRKEQAALRDASRRNLSERA
ncbi:IclR family transcriptional regulator [Saccharopolyspora spinosporotrichia]